MSKVIIVDDDPTNVALTKMLLELDGFAVVPCNDIMEALNATTTETEAFIIDFHLARGISGLDLLHDIRRGVTKAAQDTIVIITSGDYRKEIEAKKAGANSFLFKPYPSNQLSEELRRLLEGKQQNGK